jgi:hypothetical protein
MNRTFLEKERIMLSGVGIAQEFWAEVVDTSYYLVNRSPSSKLVELTPHEVYFGKKNYLLYFNVFVYDAFLHIPKEKMNKLDNKEVNCIFINCKDRMKGYKLCDPVIRKTIYSPDVMSREVGGTSRIEEAQSEKELEKLVFEIRNEEHDSDESTESDEEVEL